MSQIKLYGFLLCPFAQRVRFALESLKIEYEYFEIDLYRGEEENPSYLSINPFGQVPSIVFNNQCLFESLYLLEFLQDQFGGVFPKDPVRRGQQRIWVNYFNENVISKVYEVYSLFKTQDKVQLKRIANDIAKQIRYFMKQTKLHERIQENGNSFFEGDSLTYADYALIPHIKSLDNFYTLIFKLQFFDLIDKEEGDNNDELIQSFIKYYHNVISTDAFNHATYKIKSIPSKGDNTILDTLEFKNNQYDYNLLFSTYTIKKYIETNN